ncbi:TPA: hypothetical protein N0F65_005659 [Lagenidium giganteum]|uniref:Uncharacterized protein n=1 Tax=Lagenidium giganteum TaxID=4803 RepID=A0AAV2ZER5_9STRA|nr:TPA: hypothetical protein N0F65_005659 [Lagenidium giganteum]
MNLFARNKKKLKGCHIVPEELSDPADPSHDAFALAMDRLPKDKAAFVATRRIARDQLMRRMEALILKEAELAAAHERFDHMRQQCLVEHERIADKLQEYEFLLDQAEERDQLMARTGGVRMTAAERERWEHTKNMVYGTLPQLLAKLEDSMESNTERIRQLKDRREEIRAQRLAVREEIATQEDEIAVALR